MDQPALTCLAVQLSQRGGVFGVSLDQLVESVVLLRDRLSRPETRRVSES